MSEWQVAGGEENTCHVVSTSTNNNIMVNSNSICHWNIKSKGESIYQQKMRGIPSTEGLSTEGSKRNSPLFLGTGKKNEVNSPPPSNYLSEQYEGSSPYCWVKYKKPLRATLLRLTPYPAL